MLLPSLVFAVSSWISLSFMPLSLHWLIFFGIGLARVHFSQLTARTTGEFLNCIKYSGIGSSWNCQGSAGGAHRGQTHGFICICKRSPGTLSDLRETFFSFQAASQVSRSSVPSLLNWCCWAMEICYLLKRHCFWPHGRLWGLLSKF